MESELALAAAFLLVAVNGFFVAAEFAIVKLRPSRLKNLKKNHPWRGKILEDIKEHLDVYLSACQVGITLASLALGWIGEPAFAKILSWFFSFLAPVSDGFTLVLAFAFISFLHVVAGELAPKSMAIRHAEAIALFSAPLLWISHWLMFPAVYLLNGCANLSLRLLGMGKRPHLEPGYSSEEIALLLRSQAKEAEEGWRIVHQALEFLDFTVSDLMRPADEMVIVASHKSISENLASISHHRYSRYPFWDEDKEEITGFVHVKDLFCVLAEKKEIHDLHPFVRPMLQVPEDLAAADLLRQYRRGAPSFALITDPWGKALGFLTLHDLLSAIAGEIGDEFKKGTDGGWVKTPSGSLLGKASLPLYTLERALGLEIESPEDAHSVGGLVVAKLERLPKAGEKVEFKDFSVVVRAMKGPKILEVEVVPKKTKLKIS